MTMLMKVIMMVKMRKKNEEIMKMTTQEEGQIMINLEKEKQAEAGAEILHKGGVNQEVESPRAL